MAKSCKSQSHWNDGTSAIIDQSGIPRPLWVTRRLCLTMIIPSLSDKCGVMPAVVGVPPACGIFPLAKVNAD